MSLMVESNEPKVPSRYAYGGGANKDLIRVEGFIMLEMILFNAFSFLVNILKKYFS